jgi:KDO2-lipid IV(A) lauroyltransferase
VRAALARLRLAPDGRPRPNAPFGQGPLAARVLRGAIVGASAIAGRLPSGVVYPITRLGGTLEWATRRRKRAILARNLGGALGRSPADPVVRTLVRREILNEARRSADFLWSVARPKEFLAGVRVEDGELLEAARSQGRGVIIVTLHIGGWEIVTPVPRDLLDLPMTVVVTDDWLAWAVAGLRVRSGLEIAYDTEHPSRLLGCLRRGESVFLIADYGKPGMRTYPVRLLEGDVELPAGPATLARLSAAPIVPFVALPDGNRRWCVKILEPVPPPPRAGGRDGERAALQQLADRFGEVLRTDIEHWAAVYPMRWLETR